MREAVYINRLQRFYELPSLYQVQNAPVANKEELMMQLTALYLLEFLKVYMDSGCSSARKAQ